jgi:Zn-dependent protease with chaperone function
MSTLASLQLFVLAALLFAAFASVLASASVPLMRRLLANLPPHMRYRWLWLLAALPLIATIVGMAAALTPSLLGLIWPAYDHCLVHAGTHGHLCFAHLPNEVGGPASWLVLAAAVAFLGGRAAWGIAGLVRAARVCSRLLARGVHEPRLSASVLPTAAPVCLSIGVLKPKTVLSEGFLRAVDAAQLEAVLVHEQEHANRRDALSLLVARATTALMLPSARGQLLGELALAAEQSCDEMAARAIGDRLTMAEVILKVERLLSVPGAVAPLAASFGGTAIPLRVAALVEPPRSERQRSVLPIFIVCALLAVGAVSEQLHHLAETAVGVLVH